MQMCIGVRSWFVTEEMRKALLSAAVAVAVVIASGYVALGQGSTGMGAHGSLYTAIDLNPNGFTMSSASSVSDGQEGGVGAKSGNTESKYALLWHGSAASVVNLISDGEVAATCSSQQVGYGRGFGATGMETHALLWRGTAASVVDLNPRQFTSSEALGTSGRVQVGFGLPPTGGSHALLWRGTADNVVDLHPSGFTSSTAKGTSGNQQVGYGFGPATGNLEHGLLWRGNAASVVDLNPRGFVTSAAFSVSGGQQVGSGVPIGHDRGNQHSLLWRGSAESVVDLHPRGFTLSGASGTNGEEQVGFGDGHALLWRGSAASVVDLHPFLPSGFTISSASSIDAAGDIVGWARAGHDSPDHAILWKRNVPRPGISRGPKTTGC